VPSLPSVLPSPVIPTIPPAVLPPSPLPQVPGLSGILCPTSLIPILCPKKIIPKLPKLPKLNPCKDEVKKPIFNKVPLLQFPELPTLPQLSLLPGIICPPTQSPISYPKIPQIVPKPISTPQIIPIPIPIPQIVPKPISIPQIVSKPISIPQIVPKPIPIPQIVPKPISIPQIVSKPIPMPQIVPTPISPQKIPCKDEEKKPLPIIIPWASNTLEAIIKCLLEIAPKAIVFPQLSQNSNTENSNKEKPIVTVNPNDTSKIFILLPSTTAVHNPNPPSLVDSSPTISNTYYKQEKINQILEKILNLKKTINLKPDTGHLNLIPKKPFHSKVPC
jgi:hypothetical protein